MGVDKGKKLTTPTLVEIWRTAPYLHDGSAATIRDVVTTRNPHDKHGETSNLSSQEIDDLCAYVLSL
jgi:cytochrome c peroxidase